MAFKMQSKNEAFLFHLIPTTLSSLVTAVLLLFAGYMLLPKGFAMLGLSNKIKPLGVDEIKMI